jgi:hypothetical protein
VGELDTMPGLSSVELVASATAWPARWAGAWRLTFERDARGRLGRLAVVLEQDDAEGLDVVLRALPEDLLSQLSVRTERRLSPAAREQLAERVEQALLRQRALTERDIALAHAVPRPREPVVYEGA